MVLTRPLELSNLLCVPRMLKLQPPDLWNCFFFKLEKPSHKSYGNDFSNTYFWDCKWWTRIALRVQCSVCPPPQTDRQTSDLCRCMLTFRTIWPWLKGIYILMQIKLNVSTLMHFSRRITTFTIISMENLCAHAVIDTFITSKGFNFLFNHTTVWIAFPIEFNNEAHYQSLKDGTLVLLLWKYVKQWVIHHTMSWVNWAFTRVGC